MTTVLAMSCTLHFYSENNKVILVNNFPWNWLSTGSFVGVVVGGPLDNQFQVLYIHMQKWYGLHSGHRVLRNQRSGDHTQRRVFKMTPNP